MISGAEMVVVDWVEHGLDWKAKEEIKSVVREKRPWCGAELWLWRKIDGLLAVWSVMVVNSGGSKID